MDAGGWIPSQDAGPSVGALESSARARAALVGFRRLCLEAAVAGAAGLVLLRALVPQGGPMPPTGSESSVLLFLLLATSVALPLLLGEHIIRAHRAEALNFRAARATETWTLLAFAALLIGALMLFLGSGGAPVGLAACLLLQAVPSVALVMFAAPMAMPKAPWPIWTAALPAASAAVPIILALWAASSPFAYAGIAFGLAGAFGAGSLLSILVAPLVFAFAVQVVSLGAARALPASVRGDVLR